ncbi:MAG: MFS transporter [Novosphingobium sp.]
MSVRAPVAASAARSGPAGALGFLVALQFFYAWSWNSSDVLRPAFRATLGLSLTEVGAGYSVQVVGTLLGALATVRFEHLAGRRHALALVCAGGGLALLAGLLVTSWSGFLLQRFAIGLCSGAVFPLTIGVIVELFGARVRGRLASAIDGTYFASIALLGLASGEVGLEGWRVLLWLGGVPPLVVALAAYWLVPAFPADHASSGHAPIRLLFSPLHRAKTVTFATMLAANACGYQAFSGWMTTHLYEVARLPAAAVGAIVAAQFIGSVVGCFAWGWAIDRFGRRVGALGLMLAGGAAAVFLVLPPSPLLLGVAAAGFGLSFSAVVSIGPWLAELYPRPLRTAATAMFQWGRFVSLAAPLATGAIAARWGLPLAMSLAVVLFALAGWLWSRLPETLER